MFEIKGKYNTAKVMLPDPGKLDGETLRQISSFLDHPAFEGSPIAVMPDTHAGAGAVIGFTMKMNEYVIPNVVGVDIGCGVETYTLDGIGGLDPAKLDRFIYGNIPAGFKKRVRAPFALPEVSGFLTKDDALLIERDIPETVRETGQDLDNVLQSAGTLGGGNHFIEAGLDSSGRTRLTIHSGSRNFGLKIAHFHQSRAKDKADKKTGVPGLEYLGMKHGGRDYLKDMNIAQRFADLNRRIIAMVIIGGFFGLDYARIERIRSVHNFIDFEDQMIRKGAIRAYKGERLVIPFNMEDGLIIGKGRSNREWNFSAPHGAGRVLSRRKAKETLDLAEVRRSMKEKGVYTTSLNKGTLDEAKTAYKDKDMILSAIEPSVEIEDFVRPVYNFKAGE
ncbi:MAG: hypothetical protein A2Y33_12475 [Spirochaetes bacterium GWF1_51_8]|nr:MAG: hypothetical protein A2Y33_12475 [Spirochaetes bacterium GWF1_51_8]